MGVLLFDAYTLGHLLGGVLSCSLMQYSNIPVLVNFGIANGLHYMIERTEKSVAPNGRVLETMENHIGDILSFFIGWMIAYILRVDRYITSNSVYFLWFVLIFFTMLETLREIYPYEPKLIGAYTVDR
jgi:hypothetical protein